MMRGFIAFHLGDWRQARQDATQALAIDSNAGPSWVSSYHLMVLGLVSSGEGAWDEAVRYLEESVTMAEQRRDKQAMRLAQGALAELEVRSGRPAAAQARLVLLLEPANLHEKDVARLLPTLAWAQLMVGDVDKAAEVLAQALTGAREKNGQLTLVDALRVQALVAMRQAHWAEAAEALEEGIALAQRMPYPHAEALLLHVYGDLHSLKGEPALARERLQMALLIFRRLGARMDIEQADLALESLG
jgi:tetratricopeptide (TPR) repeat protein